MEAQHMTQQTFANFIGMSAASLSSIFNNRTKPTLNTVEAIKAKIPNINVDWLLFGTGEMFSRNDTTAPPSSDNSESAAGNEPSLDFSTSGSNDLFGNLAHAPSRQPAFSPSAGSSPSIVRQEIKYVERPQRQITEIRIYFDDLTFETFVPKK